jgi:sigma-B regulation protein RsbU (phosphoserine phosphatase)
VDGTIQNVNATLCQWLGWEAPELVGKKRFQDLLGIGSRLFHQTHWMPLLTLQGSVAEVQFELLHRDTQVMAALVNAAFRPESEGATPSEQRIDVAILIATDRRKYERELLLARRRAEELLASEREAQKALTLAREAHEREVQQRAILAEQLVGIVSHDLRNPLNAVLLGTHLLRAGALEAAPARIVTRIASSVERANRLVTDLLDFTQARLAGGLRVEPREIDLHAVVSECLDEVRLAWPGRMLEHRTHGHGSGRADSDRLAQVVGNLSNNALTYGRPDQPVTVTSVITDESLEILVHNLGDAIPEQLRVHIFEPLRRGEHSVKLGSRSVGLGLYIVREIASAHGGHVSVSSTEAEGTTFVVRLPRAAKG